MSSESLRIADQLRRAFEADAWHGPALRELLSGVTAAQACARPLPSGHTIWELVLHIEVYVREASNVARGGAMPRIYGTDQDWPVVTDTSPQAWANLTDQLFQAAQRLANGIDGFDDARLKEIVPGREYDFYYLFHGVVQHSLFHGGQIAMLKRAVSPN